jgi:hypothetical protein
MNTGGTRAERTVPRLLWELHEGNDTLNTTAVAQAQLHRAMPSVP